MRVRPAHFAFTLVPALALAASAGAHEGGPPLPGQCFGRTVRPPVVEEGRRRVQLGAGHWALRRVPARYAFEVHRTQVHPARTEKIERPALYRTLVRWQLTPGEPRRVHTAPTWRSEREQVLVEPAHAEWRRQPPRFAYAEAGPGQTAVQPTGEVLCRAWCPAKYEWRERRVMVSPGGWTIVHGAPHRRKIVERKLVRPAATVERKIPAEYRVERSRRLVKPGSAERVWVGPRWGWEPTRRMAGGGEGWSQVVCAGPLSHAFRARLQSALGARGYDAGPPDGAERPDTYRALRAFQHDHGMAEGQVTVESARALDLVP